MALHTAVAQAELTFVDAIKIMKTITKNGVFCRWSCFNL